MHFKICIIVAFLATMTAATSSEDSPNNQQFAALPDPDTTIQPANITEDDTTESSGDTDSLNCTCNDITCSNCGLVHNHTNLLHDVTTIQFYEQVESGGEEGKMYLEVHFCQLIGIRMVISNIDLKYSSVLCRIVAITELNSKIAVLKNDVACWQYTVLNAYYYELQRQYQYDHHAVPRAQLNSIFAHLKASTKALQRIKLGLGTLCPVYQRSDYLKVYASLFVMHGDDVIECILRSLVFDIHSLTRGVAYLERQLDPTLSGFMCGNL
ncbi:uncharacterized protein [Dysidea avara]|uniref:uncharacterized protein n=1 Tax=Dysidea avara TaxID=196820 RepID=UPI0033347D21